VRHRDGRRRPRTRRHQGGEARGVEPLTWKRPFAPCASIVEKKLQNDVGFRKPRSTFRCQADEAGSSKEIDDAWMVLVKATDDSEAGFLPTPEAVEAIDDGTIKCTVIAMCRWHIAQRSGPINRCHREHP